MPTLKVRKPSRNRKKPVRKKRRKVRYVKTPHRRKLKINALGGKKLFEAPYSPREVTHTDLSHDYQEVPRAAGRPLLVRGGGRLRKMNFQLTLGHHDYGRHVQKDITQLVNLARNREVIRVGYGEMESRLWRITNMSLSSVLRTQEGQIARATVDLEFTINPDQKIPYSPVNKRKDRKDDDDKKGGKRDRPKFYKIKRGDTMVKIAVRFYGKASMWRRIADVNKIKKPRHPEVGKRIRLP